MRRIKGIALNNVGDDSLKLVRANRRYSFYIRSLLDDPTFDVRSITTTTTTTEKPKPRSNNNNNNNRRVLIGTGNRFIIFKGSVKQNNKVYKTFLPSRVAFLLLLHLHLYKSQTDVGSFPSSVVVYTESTKLFAGICSLVHIRYPTL